MGFERLKEDSVKAMSERKAYEEQRQNAAAIAFVVLAESGQVDTVTASEQSALFAEWRPGIEYSIGQLRRYDGILYRCVQDHKSQEGWEPAAAASLWSVTSDPAEEWPEWSQPIGAHDAYDAGARVSYANKHWISDTDGNVWQPGIYGWTEMVE